jgi:hypothetical protein
VPLSADHLETVFVSFSRNSDSLIILGALFVEVIAGYNEHYGPTIQQQKGLNGTYRYSRIVRKVVW